MIHIQNIHKNFKEVQALSCINLTIEQGEFVSLLGPSGCGKSTLINLVAGLEKPSEGKILLHDKVITEPGTDRIMVFQNAALFPWLTVKENVAFGLKNIMKDKATIEKKVREILKKVHLSKFMNAYPHELSGGMKQRVSLARSLVMDPEILLMDEPFSALDEQTRMLLHNELQELWMETKKTIIFVTHNIREAVKLSDRVIIMGARPGTIVEEIKVHISHPRQTTDERLYNIENQCFQVLKKEIEKVAREELGNEYEFEKDADFDRYRNTMGDGI